MEYIFGIIGSIGSTITAIGVIVVATQKGRAWLIKPATDALYKWRKDTDERLKSIKRSGLRTELLLLLKDEDAPAKDIFVAYEAYEKVGGNFYIHDMFEKWKEDHRRCE